MLKNKKVKMSKKFKNFIYQFYYLNTNFVGHLEKNECCPQTPYFFYKIEKYEFYLHYL